MRQTLKSPIRQQLGELIDPTKPSRTNTDFLIHWCVLWEWLSEPEIQLSITQGALKLLAKVDRQLNNLTLDPLNVHNPRDLLARNLIHEALPAQLHPTYLKLTTLESTESYNLLIGNYQQAAQVRIEQQRYFDLLISQIRRPMTITKPMTTRALRALKPTKLN